MLTSGVGAAVGDLGTILVTSDTGVTWTSAESGSYRALRGVVFHNTIHGVAVGDSGTVLRTDDAGHTWTPTSAGTSAELRGVAFGSPDVGAIVGDDGAVLRTGDSGRAWAPVASCTRSTLRAVRFVTAMLAIAVGDDGAIVRSVDGGLSWTRVESGTNAALRDAHFVTTETGIVVGGDDRRWRSRRVVLRTTDGGATWTNVGVPRGGRLYAVTGAGEGSIVAVGEAGSSLRSVDQGRTWRAFHTEDRSASTQPTANWFAGVSGSGGPLVAVTFGGRIFHNTDSATAWASAELTPEPRAGGNAFIAGVAHAGDDVLVVGAGNDILRSVAGGPFEKTLSAGTQRVRGVRFADSLVGVAVGFAGTIQRTVDGGKTWTLVESGTKRTLWTVAFRDGTHGIAIAEFGNQVGPGMLSTGDAGLTWRAQQCVGGSNICTSASPLVAVTVRPSQIGLAVGAWGVVIKTTDGGRSWTQLDYHLENVVLQGVTMIDDTTAFAVGSGGVIIHTRDGGASWTRRASGTVRRLNRVLFVDASRGLIVGEGGTVLTTVDGGLTWRREPSRTTRDFWGLALEASGDAIITGAPDVVVRFAWTVAGQRSVASGARDR